MQSNILAALSDVFLKIFNMSMAAVWIILAVILLRLLLKRAPKFIICLLWGLAGIRLICPFSFESFLSIIPSAQVINPNFLTNSAEAVDVGVPAISSAVNSAVISGFEQNPSALTLLQTVGNVVPLIWLAGIIAMLIFAPVSYTHLILLLSDVPNPCDATDA